jgi:hypothetical protein
MLNGVGYSVSDKSVNTQYSTMTKIPDVQLIGHFNGFFSIVSSLSGTIPEWKISESDPYMLALAWQQNPFMSFSALQ